MGEDYIDQLLSSQQETLDDVVKTKRFWDPANYDTTIKDGVVLQPQYTQPVSAETGELAGPITGVLRYKKGQTAPGQTYEILDPVTGKVTGTGRFKKVGSAWDLTKQAAADLGPILGFTPLAPFVRAVGALSAAEQGDILGALASGLPIADKIPGLDAATASTLKDLGKYASVGKAAQTGNWQQVLNAASQIPGIGTNIPQELKTLSDYASKATLLQRAAQGDIGAIANLAKEYGGTTPSPSETAVGGGADIYGAYDPEVEAGLLYYGSDPSQEKYAEEDRLLGKYPAPAGDVEPAGPRTTMNPMELNRFLEANIDNPATITELLDQYYPQTINVTGTKETAPRSIRDIGTVTKISPNEKLDIPDIPVPDLSVGLKPAVPGGTKTTPTKPAAPAAQDDWLRRLAFLLGANRPEDEEEQPYQLANVPKYEGLAYGFSGEMPYMRG